MFTHQQPLVSPPSTVQSHEHSSNNASTANISSPRTSRLRGLSYLRTYTQTHFSRDHSNTTSSGNNSSGSESGTLSRSVTSPVTSTLRRSGSSSNRNNRLTLVSSAAAPKPSAAPAANPGGSASADSLPASVPTTAAVQPNMTRARASTTGETSTAAAAAAATATSAEMMPSIRFSAYYDPRSTRPSLTFPPVSRTLPTTTDAIRVGRYSERDSQSTANVPGNIPSAAPVGFKSKVVSRRHCEFWYESGKWWIKDVKSSSGTFLNHIRLSPPSQESKAFPVNDGDIVQLGIDFKGGEEMIFRCVKMRLELNRGWQNKLNTFNMAAHKRLRTMGAGADGANKSSASQDCSICLNSIAPCQSLFVAPCSHTWHFKCVRSLLTSPQYPIFICPNCRAGADLEADVEEPGEDWEQLEEEEENTNGAPLAHATTTIALPQDLSDPEVDAVDTTIALSPSAASPHMVSEPLPIRNDVIGSGRASMSRETRTPSPPGHGPDGPITPRNEAGPWVFDGSAGRREVDGNGEMPSIDAAAELTPVTPTADGKTS